MLTTLKPYLYLAGVVLISLILWGTYSIGNTNGKNSVELKYQTQANQQWVVYQKQLEEQKQEYLAVQEKLKLAEQTAWQRYKDAEENYNNVVHDAESWRVYIDSKPSTSDGVSCPASTSTVGNADNKTYAELPRTTKNNLEIWAASIRAEQEQLKAQIDYLQQYIKEAQEYINNNNNNNKKD